MRRQRRADIDQHKQRQQILRPDFTRVDYGPRADGEEQRSRKTESECEPHGGVWVSGKAESSKAAVAARSLYLPRLATTDTIFDVAAIIEAFRKRATIRPRRPIPH